MIVNDVPALNLSQSMVDNLSADDTVGGSILKLGDILTRVLDRRNNEDILNNNMFTTNIINSTNRIMGSYIGWQEIPGTQQRSEVVSKYLEALDYTGYLWAEKARMKSVSRADCKADQSFLFSDVHLIAKIAKANENNEVDEECFEFGSGTICLPLVQLQVCQLFTLFFAMLIVIISFRFFCYFCGYFST